MDSEDPQMSRQGATGMRKCRTPTILQKLEIIRSLESGEIKREVMASFNIGSSTICSIKKPRDQL
jgi:hypothetical protein